MFNLFIFLSLVFTTFTYKTVRLICLTELDGYLWCITSFREMLTCRSLPIKSYYHQHISQHTALFRDFLYIVHMKVPQRRNKNAGKSTGTSKSAKYFASHPEARKKKNAYNSEYHSSTERKKYRASLNKKTRSGSCSQGKENSHTKSGKTVCESRSVNRARNGRGNTAKKK